MIVPTPQLQTADDVKAAIDDDFAARGIVCDVEVGEYDPEKFRTGAKIMIAFGDGSITEPAGHYQPGKWWAVTVDGESDVADPLLDDAQTYILRIHGATAAGVEQTGENLRRATVLLMRSAMAGLRRQHAAPFRGPARVRWRTLDDFPVFTFGSLCEVSVTIASPILGDALRAETITQAEATSSFDLPDGTTTPEGPPVTAP